MDLEVEVLHGMGSVAATPLLAGRTEGGADPLGQGSHVAFADQRVPFRHDLGDRTRASGHHRQSRRHGLDQDEAELLLPFGRALRGQHQHPGVVEQAG